MSAPRASAGAAFETSAYSLKALAGAIAPLMATANGDGPRRGSIVGLDFDASVAWPAYDWMGVAKAALESVARYLARDLGPQGVRVNLVSAGPISSPRPPGSPASRLSPTPGRTPPRWAGTASDAGAVADAAAFLLSDLGARDQRRDHPRGRRLPRGRGGGSGHARRQ